MNFLQFFVWGSWLISLGGYMERGLHFEGGQIGAIFRNNGNRIHYHAGNNRHYSRQMVQCRTPLWYLPLAGSRLLVLRFYRHRL